LLRKSKFLVIASKSEGLPAVLLEAMMNGCIPICTNVGDISDVYLHKDFLIKYNQKEDNNVLIEKLSSAFLKASNLSLEQLEIFAKRIIVQSMEFYYEYAGKLWINLIKKL